ncbi:MAG TPA: M56 family metallopeptidase, partial [Acidobacteriaceae bacterium]|nr:M56 family metallopeptidase [Acidobacteriaceae bacterium]
MMAQFFPGVWGRLALGLANHLWQSTVFALLAALLTLALKKNQARIRYWLWFAASAKFLIPFSLLVVIGGHLSWLHHISPKQGADANAGAYLVMEEVSQPFALMDLAPMAAEATPERPSATERLRAFLGGSFVPAALTAIWLSGALFVLVTWTRRWWRISAATRNAPALEEGREAETLRRMERLAGLRRRIELKVLPVSVEPGIFGLRRPVLLWPQGISERFEDAQREAVIAHEVCHVRRRDNLTAALHMAVEAIFWFHPVVWWLETRLVEERESACDEEVLELCGQARAYAESILKVCEFCIESPLTCVSGVTGADLKRRVAGIVSGRALMRLSWPKKLLLVMVALCVVALPMMLGSVQNPLHALVAEGQALTKGW